MSDDLDASSLARVASGDQQALRDLYDRYRPRLRRFLWSQIQGDALLVDELLQEVFIAIWRGAPQFRGSAKVATWIFQIAHHQAAQAIQRRSRYTLTDSLDLLPEREIPLREDTMLDRMELAQAMASLSAAHRAAIDLVFLHGFSLAEAAQILGVPVGTIKSRLSYGRRALRLALAQDNEEARS